jgi:hypothetical protein
MKDRPMTWHVQYRDRTGEQIVRLSAPEEAIEIACQLIDDGYEVHGIGEGPLTDSIGKDRIADIYAMRSRPWMLFSRT